MPANRNITVTHDPVPSSLILQGQANFLSKHGNIWLLGSTLPAILLMLAYSLQQEDVEPTAAMWMLAVIILSGLRWLSGQRQLASSHPTPEAMRDFIHHYLLYSALISALWGSSSILLPAGTLQGQAIHLLLLAGYGAASLPILALSGTALAWQVGMVFLPAILHLLWSDIPTQQAQTLALAALLLGSLLGLAGRAIGQLLQELHLTQLQMLEQAHTDPVTQIPNRRFFDDTFKAEWRRATRDNKPLSLLMIDVDHFKHYNDRNGHHAGDQCLQIVAQCLKSVARRSTDVVARHGGEEFAILLPNTGLEDAIILAEKVRKAVEEQRIPHTDDAHSQIVTVSVGVSSCTPATSQTGQSQHNHATLHQTMLLNAADRALYCAKRNGRNRVANEPCSDKMIKSVTAPSLPATVTPASSPMSLDVAAPP